MIASLGRRHTYVYFRIFTTFLKILKVFKIKKTLERRKGKGRREERR